MSAKYHQAFLRSESISSLMVNRQLGKLDAAITGVGIGTYDWPILVSDPTTPPAGFAAVYIKAGGLYVKTDAGTVLTIGQLPTFALVQDQKAQNTDGGTFNFGVWTTRDLNTIVVNNIGLTLNANQFTLQAGTYQVFASAPAFQVASIMRLYNVTDAATVTQSICGFSPVLVANQSQFRNYLSCQFTIAGAKTYELQHWQNGAPINTVGLGIAANFTTEVYAQVAVWKVP